VKKLIYFSHLSFNFLPVKYLLFSFLLLISILVKAQGPIFWQWAQSGTCTTSDSGSSITSDNSGNVYSTGFFFGSNLTYSTTTLINAGNYDAFIVKYDNLGNFLWARSIGGAYDDVANAIVCDNSGNVFVTGYYTSSSLAIGAYTLNNQGGEDVFVVKYDPSGNVVWAKNFGGNMIEESNGITCDGSNIYVTGQFQSNTITFGTGTLTCNGSGDVFTAKYDNNGNELWAKGFGDTGLEIGYGITVTPGNDIYLTGSFKSANITFSTYTLTNQGGSDYFVARYDASGNELWAKSAGGNFDDVGTSVKQGYFGELFTTGYFKSTTITFGTSTFTNASTASADMFLVNYNGTGNETWSRAYGGNFDDISYGIVPDFAGNVFIGGHIHSSTITIGAYSLTISGVGDAFVAELNAAGTVIWAQNQGGLSDEGINGMGADPGANVLVTGFYNSSSISFGTNTLNNNGSSDMFDAKLFNPPSGITENKNQKSELILFPNPTSAGFTIKPLPQNAKIQIFDLTGKELLRYEIPNSPSVFIETQNLTPGIYLVNVTSETFSDTRKLSVFK
jgi:hypothetical protein